MVSPGNIDDAERAADEFENVKVLDPAEAELLQQWFKEQPVP